MATAMDSLGIPQQIRRQRLGHSGNSVTDIYTHTFTDDERNAAEKLGELFGTGWPEIDKGKVISFPNLSQKEEGLAGGTQQALMTNENWLWGPATYSKLRQFRSAWRSFDRWRQEAITGSSYRTQHRKLLKQFADSKRLSSLLRLLFLPPASGHPH